MKKKFLTTQLGTGKISFQIIVRKNHWQSSVLLVVDREAYTVSLLTLREVAYAFSSFVKKEGPEKRFLLNM